MKVSTALLIAMAALAVGCKDSKDQGGGAIEDSTTNSDPNLTDDDGDGLSEAEGDCDDTSPTRGPGATEICNGSDDDCDDVVDEDVTTTFYQDSDADGFGDAANSTDACEKPEGYVPTSTDCNDSEAAAYPGNVESCDLIDNDCDGVVDNGVTTTYYADTDNDGFGDVESAIEACSLPAGYVTNSDDCDDTNMYAWPGNPEVCDEVDNNCDGTVDEGVTTTYYADVDGDQYGATDLPVEACSLPTGYAEVGGDCDDSQPAANPGELETCDTIDNDCDGVIDEDDAVDAQTWYADADKDGYGDAATAYQACYQPSGYVPDNTDCDDKTYTTNPGASEYCDVDANGVVDGVDDDCNGQIDEDAAVDVKTWYRDADSDSYGDAATTDINCSQPVGYVPDNTDCLDLDSTAYPGALEYCDGVDDDCDGTVDEDPVDGNEYYLDSDGDTFGDPANTFNACSLPAGYSENDYDCDDVDAGEPVVADAINGSTSGTGTAAYPFSLLQDAIDNANTCVIAMAGTYRETVDVSGKSITITGVDGSDYTTIDANYSTCSAAQLYAGTCSSYAPALTIAGGVGATPVISGFTITGGTGEGSSSTTSTTCADSSAASGTWGPTTGTYETPGAGPGTRTETVTNNSNYGKNTCSVTIYEFLGGGIYVDGDDPTFTDMVVYDNNLPAYEVYHPAADWTQVWVYSYGGGIAVVNSDTTMEGVEVLENYADQGGGAYVTDGGMLTFEQGKFFENEAEDGGAVNLDDGSADFANAIMAFNVAGNDGGGVFQQTGGTFSATNVTIAGNSSASGSYRGDGVFTGPSTTLALYNSIMYGDNGNYIVYSSSSTAAGSYNDWYAASGTTNSGYTAGSGEINADPKFTKYTNDGNYNNDNFTLASSSSAINAGDPSITDADGSVSDMGAYGGPDGSW